MKKRFLAVLFSAVLACSLLAGCGDDSSSKKDHKKTEASSTKDSKADSKADSESEAESELQEESEAADSTTTASGKFADMEAYVNDPTVKASLDQVIDSMANSGMSMEVVGEGNTLYYKYTYSTQIIDGTTTLDDAKAALETAMDAQKSTMQGVADGLTNYVDQSPVVVKAQYFDVDGTLIYEAEFISAN